MTSFVQETESQPETKAKRARRTAACAGTTPGPACTADGHGALAPQLTAFLRDNNPARLGLITGIYIDKDMPRNYGAYTSPCGAFTPPLAGGYCTFVPDYLENEAGVYNAARSNAIGRRDRAEWRTNALEILTHETEHARFLSAPALTTPACDLSKFQWDLSELAAITTGFAIVYRRSFRKPPEARRADLGRWFDWNVPIRRNSETIGGIVRLIRCQCNCADADSYITRAIGFATTGWNSGELSAFHSELTKPKYALRWPIQPPAAVDVTDLPPAIPTTDPEDLPIASGR